MTGIGMRNWLKLGGGSRKTTEMCQHLAAEGLKGEAR